MTRGTSTSASIVVVVSSVKCTFVCHFNIGVANLLWGCKKRGNDPVGVN